VPTIADCSKVLGAFQVLYQFLGRKMPADLRGLAGEVMVWRLLLKNGIGFTVKGGQSGCDILLDSGVRIEVRTSRAIPQAPDNSRGWAWQLQKVSEKEGVKYDFIVCVALGDDLAIENAHFYILSDDEAMEAIDIHIPRFRSVKKKLWLYESMDVFFAERKKHPEYFNDWEEGVNRNKERYRDWNKLRSPV